MSLAAQLRGYVTQGIASRRRATPLAALARLSHSYLAMYDNRSYDLERNGEAFVLRSLSPEKCGCVLDVGANVGDWAATARAALPQADVHCFEIVPATAQQLGARFRDDPRV